MRGGTFVTLLPLGPAARAELAGDAREEEPEAATDLPDAAAAGLCPAAAGGGHRPGRSSQMGLSGAASETAWGWTGL